MDVFKTFFNLTLKTFFNLTLLEKVATIEYVEGSFGI